MQLSCLYVNVIPIATVTSGSDDCHNDGPGSTRGQGDRTKTHGRRGLEAVPRRHQRFRDSAHRCRRTDGT